MQPDVDALAAEVVLLMASALAPVKERLAALDARALVPGPRGPAGEKGDAGTRGEQGPPGEIPAAVIDRLVSLETRVAAIQPAPTDVTPDDLAASLSGLLTEELAALTMTTPTMKQKRIVRDARGHIERVVEEPAC